MQAGVIAALGLAAVLASATLAPARSQGETIEPAELPPGDFQGMEYVDSKGCVFLRIGAGEAVLWVPRITRDRRMLCGAETAAAPPAPEMEASEGAPALRPTPRPEALPAAQTRLVWSDTLPRRLVEVAVEASPAAKPPEQAKPSRTKPAAPALSNRQPGPARWVQVGAYRNPSNAKASAARVRQMGLPVYQRKSRNGSQLQLVFAGPFDTPKELSRALQKARAGGFTDAFYRK